MEFYSLINTAFIFSIICLILFLSQVNRIMSCLLCGLVFAYCDTYYGFNSFYTLSQTNVINEIAILILMFTLGVHFNLKKIRHFKKQIVYIISLQTVITLFLFYQFNVYLFPGINTLSIWHNIFLSLSQLIASTVVSSQILVESDEFSSKYGQIAFAILILQDIMTIILLSLTKSANTNPINILIKIILVLFLLPFLKKHINTMYPILLTYDRESICIFMPFIITFFSFVCLSKFKISLEFAAFCSGFLNSNNPFIKDISNILEPIQHFFLCLFILDAAKNTFLCNFSFIYISKFLLFYIFKIIIIFSICLLISLKVNSAIKMAIILSTSSEVNFITFPVIFSHNPNRLHYGLYMTFISMLASPIVFNIYVYFCYRKNVGIALEAAKLETVDIENHIIVVGFGKMGVLIYEHLQTEVIPHVIIDNDIKLVSHERQMHKNIYFMDARFESTYRSIGINRASIILITIRCAQTTIRAVKAIRNINKTIKIATIYYDKVSFQIFQDLDAIPISFELGITGKPLVDYINKVMSSSASK